jgi:hypothetical protein
LRNNLIHGIASCTQDYAIEKANCVIEASRIIRKLSSDYGFNLDTRLPIRIKKVVFLKKHTEDKES